jgi:hypothetical protein
MKRLTILAVLTLFACFSFNAFSQKKDVKQVSNTSSDEPYKVHATKISIGNSALAQKVLWAWKYYDDNTTDKIADLLADDVIATFPDGSLVKGKDNLLTVIRDYRNSFSAAVSEIDACIALKTPDDPDRDVVSIWGSETDTAKDGTVTKVHLNEVWFFNKQGKVVEIHQMAAKENSDKK